MTARHVVQYPDQRLRQTAQPLKSFDRTELDDLVREMVATMRKLRGIGLAATQIGLNQQIAVIEVRDGPLVLINPKLSKISRQRENDEEGCLSVPGVFGVVPRARSLMLHAVNIQGEPYSLKANGLLARVIQHEVDHLAGKLFIDRCTAFTAGHNRAQQLGIKIISPS